MRVVIASTTGVVGRHLVPLPIGAGHEMVALCRTPNPERAEVRAVAVDDEPAALANWFPALAAPGPSSRQLAQQLPRRTHSVTERSQPKNLHKSSYINSSGAGCLQGHRTRFRIGKPLIATCRAAVRPIRSDLEHARDAGLLWW